ncbi:hypothetical protein CK203_081844 [Vitis vinifera]|uniref:Uncharacterized protein n=1 Tax=Vitis vinifera TaxID=29760 RepID=A0A438EAR4_VITVI|nr:hypothetical protein CK203_081844 [Vitis vinifera]
MPIPSLLAISPLCIRCSFQGKQDSSSVSKRLEELKLEYEKQNGKQAQSGESSGKQK